MGGGSGLHEGFVGQTPNRGRRGGRQDERRGAGEEAGAEALEQVAQAASDQAAETAVLARLHTDDRGAARGTPEALGKEEEEPVLLARTRDQHDGKVCPQVLGRHLYPAMKDAAVGAGSAPRAAGG